jgi:hypothetical protein
VFREEVNAIEEELYREKQEKIDLKSRLEQQELQR